MSHEVSYGSRRTLVFRQGTPRAYQVEEGRNRALACSTVVRHLWGHLFTPAFAKIFSATGPGKVRAMLFVCAAMSAREKKSVTLNRFFSMAATRTAPSTTAFSASVALNQR